MFYAKLNQDRHVKMYQDNTGREKKKKRTTHGILDIFYCLFKIIALT